MQTTSKTFVIDPDSESATRAAVEALGEGRYRVTLSGHGEGEQAEPRTLEIDAAALGQGVWGLLVEGRSVEVGVDREGTRITTSLAGHALAMEVLDERQMQRRSLTGGGGSGGGPELVAPMAGKVIAISSEVGQSVEQGQAVMIIEAMKMENDIKAHRSGVVTALHVAAGDTVDVGAPLIAIDNGDE